MDYEALEEERESLQAVLRSAAAVSREAFEAWPREEELAFLINVYNAATLELILDHDRPATIRDIGGWFRSPWSLEVVGLFGEQISLDRLEHDMIRVWYTEPRIHFALVCAARGCPPLRSGAYRGETLEADLQEQARVFLQHSPRRNRLENGVLYLSPIFKWYGEDFAKDRAGLKAWLEDWLPGAGGATIRWTDYDWSLNGR